MKKHIEVAAVVVLSLIFASAAFGQKNTASPVVIKDADNAARQPVQLWIHGTVNAGEDDAVVSLPPVPAAKRLVIENVSIEGFLPHGSGIRPFVRLRTAVGDVPRTEAFPLTFVFHYGWDVWAGNYSVRLYNDPGQPVDVVMMRSPDSNGGFSNSVSYSVTITGYYVDLP